MKNYSPKTLYVQRENLVQSQVVMSLKEMKVWHEVHSARVDQYHFEIYHQLGLLIQGQVVVSLKGMKVWHDAQVEDRLGF